MRTVVDPPPATPIEPVTEVLHGVEITDPYRWLEDQNSPQTRKWIEEQSAYTRAYLEAIPGRDRIRNCVEELLTSILMTVPCQAGGRYFFLKRARNQEQPAILMREGDLGEDLVLVDPGEYGDRATSLGIVQISGNGKLLSYSVRQSGEDFYSVEFFEVDNRRIFTDRLPR